MVNQLQQYASRAGHLQANAGVPVQSTKEEGRNSSFRPSRLLLFPFLALLSIFLEPVDEEEFVIDNERSEEGIEINAIEGRISVEDHIPVKECLRRRIRSFDFICFHDLLDFSGFITSTFLSPTAAFTPVANISAKPANNVARMVENLKGLIQNTSFFATVRAEKDEAASNRDGFGKREARLQTMQQAGVWFLRRPGESSCPRSHFC